MDKIKALHDLLPDFQKFLEDLCQIKLTSDLEEKAQFYRQRISDYIEQFSSQPGMVPPPLPAETPPASTFPTDPDSNIEALLAEERKRSRLNFASSTLPTLNGHSSHELPTEVLDEATKRHSMPPGFRLSKRLSGHFLSKRRSLINEPPGEDFYEAPMDQKPTQKPPPVPDTGRPLPAPGIVRHIDDLPTYDDPDSPGSPPPVPEGLPPSLPRPNSNQGYHVLNPEGQDSGGTFSTETTGHFSDDGELYEDLNEDDDSFSDYESDELETLNPDPEFTNVKEKAKKKDKDDSYWQNFVNFIESENNTCDHKGKLYFYDAMSTLNKLFKPKVYFCAATNARLLCYLPKKEYSKPQINISLQSSCEISATGKDSSKEYGIQVQVKKGKAYNFNCSSSLEADKWVETLKKYTNQGLEYDVTPCRGDSGDGEVMSPPPTGMEDPMIGKIETIMKRVFKNKKHKKHSPQITEEDGALQGFANVLGALYGEPKWQKKWIVIKNHQFSCHKSKNDDYEFAFSLKDVELGAPEQKIVKKGREGALKFSKDNDTLIYLEALNPLDVGKIMKQALNAMMVSSAASKSSLVKRETTVEKITKFYEALEQGVNEQEDQSIYVNTQVGPRASVTPSSPDSEASTPPVQDGRLYVNTQIGGASPASKKKLSAPPLPTPANNADDDDDAIYDDADNVVESAPKKRESRSMSLPWAKQKTQPLSTISNEEDDDAIYDDAENVVESQPQKRESRSMSLPWANKKAPAISIMAEDEAIYDDTDVEPQPQKKERKSKTMSFGRKKAPPSSPISKEGDAEAIYDDTDVEPPPPKKETKSKTLFSMGKKSKPTSPTKSNEEDDEGNIYDDTDNVVDPSPEKKESKYIQKKSRNSDDEEDEMYLEVFGNPNDQDAPSTLPTTPTSANDLLKKASSLFSASANSAFMASPFNRRKKEEDKKEPEEEPEEESGKKDKKKKDKKEKKKKKKLKKDEIEHPDEPPPDPPQPAKQQLTRQLNDPSPEEPINQEESHPEPQPEVEPVKRPLTRQLSSQEEPHVAADDAKEEPHVEVDNSKGEPKIVVDKVVKESPKQDPKSENKFKDSDKKHLLDADRLQVEKKEVEARKKELGDRKKELQNKKKTIDDPTERANLDLQIKNVQTEWSACSKKLAEIGDEIEKATKAAVPQLPTLRTTSPSNESQLMKNSPASLRRGCGDSSDSRRSSGSSSQGGLSVALSAAKLTSPERECATSDMSLQEKIKRFQQK